MGCGSCRLPEQPREGYRRFWQGQAVQIDSRPRRTPKLLTRLQVPKRVPKPRTGRTVGNQLTVNGELKSGTGARFRADLDAYVCLGIAGDGLVGIS